MPNEQTLTLLVTEWFWNILETSEHKLQKLAEKLEQLSKEELIAFQVQYEYAEDFVNPLYTREMGQHIEYCSEDHVEDFADWVVSQGHVFFDLVRSNPASAQEYLVMYNDCKYAEKYPHLQWDRHVEREEYRGWQSPGFIAGAVCEWRFDEDLDDLVQERLDALFGA